MKRSLMVLVLPFIAACGDSPTATPDEGPDFAVLQNDRMDMAGEILYAGGCGIADPLTVTKGTYFIKVQSTSSKNGGEHFRVHTGYQGVQATDALGNHYQIQVVQSQNQNQSPDAQGNLTLNSHARIVGAGAALDGSLRVLVHITTNANGDVTAEVDRNELVCH